MTDERYNEIDNMSLDSFRQLSDAEQQEYNAARYLKESKTEIPELLAHVETAQQGYLPIWATGFNKLDQILDGGFLGGNLVVVGAVSSLGKTSFVLQIGTQIAAAGKDVLIFSLEMSKNELNAKIISRYSYELTYTKDDAEGWSGYLNANRLTMGDVLRGRVGRIGEEKRKVFDAAVEKVKGLSEHLFIIRDNDIDLDKIEDIVQAHEDATGRKPFVILDYLQILKAREENRTTDKRLLTDDDVNRLKDLAVKTDIPILVISSFNRMSYLDPVSMGSFKESGTIEYSSDTLIALQYSGMQYQKHWFTDEKGKRKLVYESKTEHDTRVRQLAEKMDIDGAAGKFLPIDVVLLKNRGVSKGKILFEFCPKYNIFREKLQQDAREYDYAEDTFDDNPFETTEEDDEDLGTI